MSTATVTTPRIGTELSWKIQFDTWTLAFASSARQAAERIVENAVRQQMRGKTDTVQVLLIDEKAGTEWDGSSSVADVLKATGWPENTEVARSTVIDLLEAVLQP